MKLVLGYIAFGVVTVLLTSCAAPPAVLPSLRLSPAQAVINAAETPAGVSGVFEMVVRATGRQDGFLYLNSERDYRDPRNLTIAVSPTVEQVLEDRLGSPLERQILNRAIAVRGTAKKVKIYFTSSGRPTSKYYFQTHLKLRSHRDLTVEGERPTA